MSNDFGQTGLRDRTAVEVRQSPWTFARMGNACAHDLATRRGLRRSAAVATASNHEVSILRLLRPSVWREVARTCRFVDRARCMNLPETARDELEALGDDVRGARLFLHEAVALLGIAGMLAGVGGVGLLATRNANELLLIAAAAVGVFGGWLLLESARRFSRVLR